LGHFGAFGKQVFRLLLPGTGSEPRNGKLFDPFSTFSPIFDGNQLSSVWWYRVCIPRGSLLSALQGTGNGRGGGQGMAVILQGARFKCEYAMFEFSAQVWLMHRLVSILGIRTGQIFPIRKASICLSFALVF
jgi:hypothetical protein